MTRGAAVPITCALLFGQACHPSQAPGTQMASAPAAPRSLRLPRDVVPLQYDLNLRIDPAAADFSGRETIAVDLRSSTRSLRLHGRGLKVTAAAFVPRSEPDRPRQLEYRQENPDGDAVLEAGSDLPAGEGGIQIEWQAPWSTQVDGLYSVKDGGESYAFTQFEPLFARRMFPCFDEPSFKTPFAVTVEIPSADVAIGNAPVQSDKPAGDGTHEIRFATTAKLPTYLLALAVGPFDVVHGPDVAPNTVRDRPLPLRGVAPKGKGTLLKYALDHTGGLVTTLEQYFGIAYPWEKLDLIALPDFGPGAMENAAAITFREWLILLDGDKAPAQQRRAFAEVTAHELAHQWFGDLVTLAWWNDLWLNEAFASWMGTRTLESWDPSMKADVGLVAGIEGAMDSDSLAAARRIRQPIETNDDIFNAFDGITYAKGAGVIGMVEQWVGPEKFRKGVHDYLAAHAYGNGSTDDFVASIATASGKEVVGPFHTFLDQPGVPLIDVTLQCAPSSAALALAQQRYRPLGSSLDQDESWNIPFCSRASGNSPPAVRCDLLDGASATASLPECPQWIMPNAGGNGYYRFALDRPAAEHLVSTRESLSIAEQLAVADSIAASERAGHLTIPEAYELLAPFASAGDRRVASTPTALLSFVREQVATAQTRALVEARARQLYAPVLQRLLASASDDEARLFLRGVIQFELGTGRDPALRAQARAKGLQLLGLPSDVQPSIFDDPNEQDLAMVVAVEEGDATVFDKAVAALRSSSEPALRRRLLGAVGYANGELGAKARDLMFTDVLRRSELLAVLGMQEGRLETREETWQWVLRNGDKLMALLPEEHAGAMPFTSRGFCSDARADEVEAYFKTRVSRLPGGPRNLAAAVESIRLCAARLKAHGPGALEYFGHKG
jgi:alanyl aminopeptidase